MNLRMAFAEKFGLRRKYFVAILRFVEIYAFCKAFIELQMHDSFLLSKFNTQQKSAKKT